MLKQGDFMVELVYFATPEEFRAWLKRITKQPANSGSGSISGVQVSRASPGPRRSMKCAASAGSTPCASRLTSAVHDSLHPSPVAQHLESVNVARVEARTAEGRMQPAGLRVFADRKKKRPGLFPRTARIPPTRVQKTNGSFAKTPLPGTFFNRVPAPTTKPRSGAFSARNATKPSANAWLNSSTAPPAA